MVRRLVGKLIRKLSRIWDRTPGNFAAIRVSCDGTNLSWAIVGRVLQMNPVGGTGAAFSLALDGYTIGSLTGYIASQTGYSAVLLAGENSGFSAFSLPDQSGNTADSDGAIINGASNLNWLYLDAVGSELETAKTQISAMPALMATPTSSGEWLDFLGGFFNVPRDTGETDAAYGPRIIAEVTMPRGNNKAIEAVLVAALGQVATVTDVVERGPSTPSYNGVISYNGAHTHDATGGTPIYGLFDVVTAYDLINAPTLPAWQTTVAALVERMRDAGTQMRSLTLTGSALADQFTGPGDASALASQVSITDTLNAPIDAPAGNSQDILSNTGDSIVTDTGRSIEALGTQNSFLAGAIGYSDVLAAPSDLSDTLLLADHATYSGRQTHSGGRLYSSGLTVTETLEGAVSGAA